LFGVDDHLNTLCLRKQCKSEEDSQNLIRECEFCYYRTLRSVSLYASVTLASENGALYLRLFEAPSFSDFARCGYAASLLIRSAHVVGVLALRCVRQIDSVSHL